MQNLLIEFAEYTLNALGGANRLQAMIGANCFGCDNRLKSLSFHFKGCKKANIVNLELKRDDTYTFHFKKFSPRDYSVKDIQEFSGVQISELRTVFESFTGLYLTIT